MTIYKARKSYDEVGLKEIYWVEKTDPRYGFPAVLIPKQPKFNSFQEAQDYARRLNSKIERTPQMIETLMRKEASK